MSVKSLAVFTDRTRAIRGFHALEYLAFSPTQQALAFGETITRRKQFGPVKNRLIKRMPIGHLIRADCFVKISVGLSTMYTMHESEKWMNGPNLYLDDASPKELILSGSLSDIERIVDLVEALAQQGDQ